ncbi:hypothetical protein BJY16_001431 [Actinoplanes octamycinicus]|uniref:Uncharacterized protein n=1 Tax=Actinoplanes octamycinicus TaxID=135948 RepID=A0A7W7M5N5_9ACTN|nr:hypothetical protein [Actinoplanes octamycinicus]MBB4737972.1 hypothetical protein [Actinoplanes octamycinicus]GIE58977.1 hypothetical protein Aoc01nite_43790 [Actinoplanes octamycinicus]
MTSHRDLDQILRNAAEPVAPRGRQPLAQQLLDDIVRTDPTTPAAPVTMTARTRRPRLALAGAALVLAAAAVFTVNAVGADGAYASWTNDPSPLPASEAQSIAARCVPAGTQSAQVAIGERRGEYAYVNVRTADGSITCFRDHDGRVHDTSVLASPVDAALLGTRGIELYAWPQLHTEEGYARLMAGRLGTQVKAVEVTVRHQDGTSGPAIRATVSDGYFAAWYPEGLEESNTNSTSLTLRLADGSTVGGLAARDLMEEPMLN